LSGCRLLPLRDLAQQVNQGLIRFPSLWRKSRELIAEIGTIERSVFVDFSREEALAQRAVRNEADPKFFQRRQDFLLRIAIPKRVFALHRCDGLDSMCATNRLCSCLRKAKLLYLAFLNQVLHCSRYIFDWHVGVHAVLIEQVDAIDLESLERGFGDFLDVLWPTIQTSQTSLRLGINFPPKLGGYHHLPTERGDRKSTRLNSSHVSISYAVFCLKKKKKNK